MKTNNISSKLKKILVALLIIVPLLKTNATNYYVSNNGNNNNSGNTIDSAWLNINYAVNYSGLAAGDFIYILGGTYFERSVMTKSGTIGNNITVTNYNGQLVTINGSSVSTSAAYNYAGLFEVRASNVIINGLKVINARWDKTSIGISVQGPNVSNVTVQNCITNNTSSCGIGIWGNVSDYSGVTNVIIQNNDISQGVVGGYQENLSICGGVDNFIIRNNNVHDSTNAPDPVNIPLGIDAKTNVRNGKIYNNTVYNLSYAGGIYVDGYDNTAYNIDIYNNKVYNCAWNGVSIGAEEGGSDYNINIYNNILYNNKGNGIGINNSNISAPNNIHDVNIYNNTIYANGGINGGYGICNFNDSSYNVVIKNNILSQNAWSNAVVVFSRNPSVPVISNNISDGPQNAYYPGSVIALGTGSIFSNPSFVNAASTNFKLNSNSPAINAATATLAPNTDFDGNARPSGGAYDIGAYEFGATSNTVAVTSISLNPVSATILVNGTQQLNATVAPANATNKNVSWSSSNTAVASVNNTGLVTGIAAGNATITTTTQDGNKTATSQITVNPLLPTPGLLLINPGFENGLSSGWTSDWGNSIITTQIKNSGVNALQIGSQSGGRAQPITAGFSSGNEYVLSAWARLSSAGSVGNIGVLCKNSSGAQLGNFYGSPITNFDAFLNKSVTFIVPAGTTLMEVYAYYDGSSSGKLYVDDFNLVTTAPSTVAVTSISLNLGSATILVNGTQQLNATVAPANATNKNVSWSSSNTAVASVNNTGLVTGIAAGNATITATTQDGNKTATSQITVNPLSPTPGLLLINPGFENGLSSGWTSDWGNSIITTQIKNSGVNALQIGSQSGGRAQRITAGFTAGNQYTLSAWARLSSVGSVGNIGVICKNSSGAQLGNFYGSSITNFDAFLNKSVTFTVPAGTISMEVYAYYDGSSSGKLYVDDFNLVTTTPAGISNKNSDSNDSFKVDVYPNPVVSDLNLTYNLKTAGNVTFLLNNSYGNQIKQFSSKAKVAGEQTLNMDVSDLKNGIYFIRITNSDGEQVIKKILVNNK